MTTYETTRRRLIAADPKVEKFLADAVRYGMRMPDDAMRELMAADMAPRLEAICSRIENPQLRHELREAFRDALDCHSFYVLSAEHAKANNWAPGYAGKTFFRRYGLWPRFVPMQRSRIGRAA